MGLINGMIEDSNNGVCLKKNRHYYTFNKTLSGCTYIDSLEEYNENYYTGLYVIPYINKNPNFNYNDNVLTISGITMSDWFINYMNSLATTGYVDNGDKLIEDRIIHSDSDNKYYYLSHYDNYCDVDTESKFGIVNEKTNEIWDGLNGEYYYDILDSCNYQTGNRYVKTMDINEFSVSYKNVIEYKKELTETLPNINLKSYTVLSTSSVQLTGEIVDNGGFSIKNVGICYSRSTTPTVNDSIVYINGWSTGEMDKIINNLSEDSYYYIRFFAENPIGISYSNTIIIKTNNADNLQINTTGPFNKHIKKLDIGGIIINPDQVKIKKIGVCWSTNENPTINNNIIEFNYNVDNFQYTIENLQNGFTYYYRSYVITQNFGVFYGNNVFDFMGGTPVLDTTIGFNTTRDSVEMRCSILDIGWPDTIYEAGFCYVTGMTTPTTGDTKVLVTNPESFFKKTITGLTPYTYYSLMAYIINDPSIAGGIAYSPNKYIMLTKNYTAPVLSDIGLTPISSDQIDLICTLLDDGGKSITKYGVCYRESLLGLDNFYVGDDNVIDLELGTSLSTGVDFHTLISNLKPNTEYSFRTYAINDLTMNGTTSYSNTSHVTTYDKITIYIFSYANIYYISITTPDGTIYKENVGDQIIFDNVKHGTAFSINVLADEIDANKYLYAYDQSSDQFEYFEVNSGLGSLFINAKTGNDGRYNSYEISIDSTLNPYAMN